MYTASAILDHVAILVPSVDEAARRFATILHPAQPAETFLSEGTRERYIGSDVAVGRILLLEVVGDGPYHRAQQRYGYGLHHVAVSVKDTKLYMHSLRGSGWHLTPASLETYHKTRTVWLCRAGLPWLVEVLEGARNDGGTVVDRLDVDMAGCNASMLERLCVESERIQPSEGGTNRLWIDGVVYDMNR